MSKNPTPDPAELKQIADHVIEMYEANTQLLRGLLAREQARQPTRAASNKRVTDTDKLATRARRLRDKGMTYKEIGEAIERDASTVRRLLKRPIR